MSETESTDHVDDLLAAYALDAVDEAERVRVEAHLDGCPSCRREVEELREASVGLSDGFDVAPPPQVRQRLLEQVAAEAEVVQPIGQRRRGSQWVWGLAAAGLVAVGSWGIWEVLDEDLTSVEQVIQADDAVRHEAELDGTPLAVVTSQEQDRAVLVASDLPDLPDGEVYQAWFVRGDGSIDSAGLVVDPGSDIELEGDPDGVTAVALSVEPAGGSTQPTTEPVAAIPLEG
jgi:anti-sigma-K factor RskA